MPRSTRRSQGEGSLTQRKDGRWQGALQGDGRRRTVYGATRQEAAQKLEALKRQSAATGMLANPGRRTVGDLLAAWLEAKSPIWKPSTLESYTKVCAHDIQPTLGRLPIARVTPERIARLCGALQAEAKHRTALKVYRVLSQALALAVRWGWLANNPADRVDVPRYRPGQRGLWTPEQVHAFLHGTVDHPLHPLWLLAISSGCRLGELLALTWPDVDLGAGMVSITKSVQRVNGERIVTTPKTRAGTRIIALPPETMRALRKQEAWCLAHGGAERVFPIAPVTVGRALRAECQRLGLPVLTMHALRHLHASLLLAEGLPLPEVSRRLGHANPSITASIYSHAVRDDTLAAQAIERILLSPAEGDRL
jgi:integrase